MVVVENRRVVLESRPPTYPTEDNFKVVHHNTIDIGTDAALKDGEILVQTKYLSIDPYLRLSMGRPGQEPREAPNKQSKQFKDGFSVAAFGAPFGGRGAGVVLQSKNNNVKVGDLVAADWKWEEYPIFDADQEATFEVLPGDIFSEGNLSTSLGILSVSGSHAYYGYNTLNLKKGDTLVISSAGGNIGIIVSQIAKVNGVHTIGLTGSDDKAQALVTQGLVDHAINYKKAGENADVLADEIRQVAPNGVNGYYDNAGGFISDAVWKVLVKNSHVYICGGISWYNAEKPGPNFYETKSTEDVTVVTGREVSATYINNIPIARNYLWPLIQEGKVKPVETVVNGFENTHKAFVDMYQGKNLGKAVVKV